MFFCVVGWAWAVFKLGQGSFFFQFALALARSRVGLVVDVLDAAHHRLWTGLREAALRRGEQRLERRKLHRAPVDRNHPRVAAPHVPHALVLRAASRRHAGVRTARG